jgi:hypothetical protein
MLAGLLFRLPRRGLVAQGAGSQVATGSDTPRSSGPLAGELRLNGCGLYAVCMFRPIPMVRLLPELYFGRWKY